MFVSIITHIIPRAVILIALILSYAPLSAMDSSSSPKKSILKPQTIPTNPETPLSPLMDSHPFTIHDLIIRRYLACEEHKETIDYDKSISKEIELLWNSGLQRCPRLPASLCKKNKFPESWHRKTPWELAELLETPHILSHITRLRLNEMETKQCSPCQSNQPGINTYDDYAKWYVCRSCLFIKCKPCIKDQKGTQTNCPGCPFMGGH